MFVCFGGRQERKEREATLLKDVMCLFAFCVNLWGKKERRSSSTQGCHVFCFAFCEPMGEDKKEKKETQPYSRMSCLFVVHSV